MMEESRLGQGAAEIRKLMRVVPQQELEEIRIERVEIGNKDTAEKSKTRTWEFHLEWA